jgi:outer membrane protein
MFRGIARLALLLVVCSTPTLAQEESLEAEESRWRLGAAFGYGNRTNPLVQSDDIPIYVDLDIAWFGDHWFFDNGDLGLTFADNDLMTASIVTRFNSDRVFFGKTDLRFVTVDATGLPLSEAVEYEVPDRDYAIELGVEILTDGEWGRLQISAFHDVSNTHEGYELYADYSYGWRSQRLYIEPSFGVSYKSAELNNYYWGITEDEAGVVVLPYEAAAGVNWHTRFMVGYQLSRHWAVSVAAEYERINDEAAASPIVEDRNVLGYFAGVSYRF